MTNVDVPRHYLVTKRLMDVAGASIALVVLGLPMTLISLAIRVDSKGPAIFRQTRVGQNGKPFEILKFRTMQLDGDDSEHRQLIMAQLRGGGDPLARQGGVQKLADDTRVTRVGRILRRNSLDELPQFVNVLRGEMSLVGPRPHLPWETELFSAEHLLRLVATPGLTGLWQVKGRGELTMAAALDLDVEYVRHRSVWLDLKILALTPRALLRSRHQTA